jgi:CDP-diacylglycerol--glycerol-3-phosphate 3-phosphatidyltransferase
MRELPNILTIGRLLAAPGVAVLLALFPGPAGEWAALALFLAAAATDWIDGRIARAWGVESEIGRVLDPIADKAMALTALVVVVGVFGDHGLRPALAIPAAAIVLRETLVSGLREALGGRAVLAVTQAAKWKTTVQLVALSCLLAASPLAGTVGDFAGSASYLAGVILLWLAALLTVTTGWAYLRKALAVMRADREHGA